MTGDRMGIADASVRLRNLFKAPDTGFIPAIQGLRGLAALSVVATHIYAMPYLLGLVPAEFPQWARDSLSAGGRGVELFFIISGYLIPASLVRHGALSKFFYDRALRIMPVFVILHLIVFVIGPFVGYKFFAGLDPLAYVRLFFTNLFFLQDLVGDPIAQQNAWTLTYEWAFYVWFALLFMAAVRRNWVVAALLAVLGLGLAWFFPRIVYFALGMLMASLPVRLALPGAPGLILGALCLALMYYLCEYVAPAAGLIPAALIFALVLSPQSGFARFLGTAPLQFVGKISYSLYLVHPFALFALLMLLKRLIAMGVDPWMGIAGFAIAGVAASLLASAASYALIELRLRRFIQQRLSGSGFRMRLRRVSNP
ncbi:acyltransferase [Bosea sp. ASV33]|uniref:acyltransferase family protein n=1 Tax=Bosea sp. ASV33 TaxID=2795106 RepID=UPI0020C0569A|nr:acyltransferase [Bosea sp. ASV33]